MKKSLNIFPEIFILIIFVLSCSSPSQGITEDTTEDNDAIPDIIDIKKVEIENDISKDDMSVDFIPADSITDGKTEWKKPQGYASVTFFVDDSKNKTYADGQILWTGSFIWDSKANIIEYATSWLPTDGPYPPLYDDGPISSGGHEMEGAAAGDHIFSTEVYFKAEEETTIEYGALNEFLRWIWIGPNGLITIPKDSTDIFTASGLVLPQFGNYDLKITIDMKGLHKDFAAVTPDMYKFYIKGSMNSWTPVQLLDDGNKGDDEAGDSILTYVQKNNLGPHDGLLADGFHAQFVFVFAMEDVDPDDGLEYKIGSICAGEGIKAYSDFETAGTFSAADIVYERDSRGNFFNTTVIIGDSLPWCVTKDDCYEPAAECTEKGCKKQGEVINPEIQFIDPVKGSVSGGTEVTITGKYFQQKCKVLFGGAESFVSNVNEEGTEIKCATTAHEKGIVTIKVENPDGGSGEFAGGFEFEENKPPNLPDWAKIAEPVSVITLKGNPSPELKAEVWESGVTEGQGAGTGLSAQIGWGNADADPSKNPDGFQWISAKYLSESGNNDVWGESITINTEGDYAFVFRLSMDNGKNWLYADTDGTTNDFSNLKMGSIKVVTESGGPFINEIKPESGSTAGNTEVVISGGGFKSDSAVYFDDSPVTVKSAAETSITVLTPKHAQGYVKVKVKNPDDKYFEKDAGFVFVFKGTPTIDGTISSDWDETWKVSENSKTTDWGQGKNELKSLWIAFDYDYLYVGINGISEAKTPENKLSGHNYITGYIDRDYGNSSGYAKMTDLTDAATIYELDDALSSVINVKATGFGAEMGFGTGGMESFKSPDLGKSNLAGFRKFVLPGDFSWLQCEVAANAGEKSIEFKLPMDYIFEGVFPDKGATVAIFIRLVSASGSAVSNQALPEDSSANSSEVTKVFQFMVK